MNEIQKASKEHETIIFVTALAHYGGLLKRGNDRSYILHLITVLTRSIAETAELQLSEILLKDMVEEAEREAVRLEYFKT